MSQEQIRVERTSSRQRDEQPAAPLSAGATATAEQVRQLNAIDDAIRDVVGPAPSTTEMIGAPREQTTVRDATNSEAFVNGFRQQGGE